MRPLLVVSSGALLGRPRGLLGSLELVLGWFVPGLSQVKLDCSLKISLRGKNIEGGDAEGGSFLRDPPPYFTFLFIFYIFHPRDVPIHNYQ